jgi:hypothetical protein
MKHRNNQGIFIVILLTLFVILMVPGNNAMAYYGLSGAGNYYGVTSSPNGALGGLGSLYGMYGSSLYGGMYGMYGSSLYGGMYGSSLYGGMYGSSLYGMYGGGLYGMYGGYGGLSLGLGNLMNPLPYYSYGGMSSLLGNFDPLGDPLLGFGMLSIL